MLEQKYSVVVPVYNGEKYIVRCIDALVNQEGCTVGTDYEIIVVDDSSSDSTVEKIRNKPIRIISLEKNSGRTIARETGVRAAQFENILLIDCKVKAAANFLQVRDRIKEDLLMVGDLGEEDDKRLELITMHRLFYLLRCWYYKPYFPQKKEIQTIDRNNFFSVPKGLTAFFITKENFLLSLPKERGKNINDDTRLFWNLVFQQNKIILRCKNLKAVYEQEEDLENVKPWLIHRGVMFVDFLLIKRQRYMLAIFLFITLLIPSVYFVLKKPIFLIFMAVLCLLGFTVICAYLSRRLKDFPFLLKFLPMVIYLFSFGIAKGLALKALGNLDRKKTT